MIMITDEQLHQIPIRRIEPFDGMSITAEVWGEAHEYHRQRGRLHHKLSHSAGILTGLKVIANDPPDDAVYIMPGVALDSEGRLIVIREAITYDLGKAKGLVYILLNYDESSPRPDDTRVYEEGDPNYIRSRYSLEAGTRLPKTPYVELARVRRVTVRSNLKNAKNLDSPGKNEIDLRFRREVEAAPPGAVSMAVCAVGDASTVVKSGLSAVEGHAAGANNLARALSHSEAYKLWVDDDASLNDDLQPYDLVYLVGQSAFQLTADEMKPLYDYLQSGGTLLVESCRRKVKKGNPPADASFLDLFTSLGVNLKPLSADDTLLKAPYFFTAPPAGFESEGQPAIQISEGVIFSSFDFGCLWAGDRRSGAASREELRSAMEWGANIVAYALRRSKE
ncbi:MAG: hypothetical protein B6243_02665 [Anaerolineaceae bacterium 4572_5.2]|nr:MAG: hypothetical protein B6243_02665 [Anaerolineaceae bacterium 4572_5.2]